jgi:hypothetical protein
VAWLYNQAADYVHVATADVGRRGAAGEAASNAAADTLTVVARHAEGARPGPLHEAAEALDRATRPPHGWTPGRTPPAAQLRAVSRLLGVAGQLSDNKALLAVLRLIVNLALLADALADLRESQRRLHQARSARTAARLLRSAADMPAGTTRTTPQAMATPLTGPPTSPSPPRRAPRRETPRSTARPRSR